MGSILLHLRSFLMTIQRLTVALILLLRKNRILKKALLIIRLVVVPASLPMGRQPVRRRPLFQVVR